MSIINLATIDFCPSNGGGEAVIRPLDVTENGTYRAPAGVDGYNPVNVNVSGGGSITPEEQAALDTLVDASEGVLYTDELSGKSMKIFRSSYIPYVTNGVCDFGNGEVYYYYGARFLKFNKDTLNWDSLIDGYMTSMTDAGLWKDASGRFYDGSAYQIDLETKSLVSIDTECSYLFTNNGKTNILYGQYGVWCVNKYDLLKFDESTQKFVSGYEINLPADYQDDLAYCMCTRFKYDGHILYDNGNKTYEIVEYEDHIDVVDVTNTYYIRPSFSSYFNNPYIFGTDSGLFYMYDLDFYQYNPDNQTWEQLSKDITGGASFNNKYGVTGDFVVGGIWFDLETYSVINLGDDWKNTTWTAVKDIAVDLSSDQSISGTKSFNNISAGAIKAGNITPVNDTLSIGGFNANMTVNSKSIDAHTTSGIALLDNHNIATTDKCILNVSIDAVGPYFDVAVDQYTDFSRANYFKALDGNDNKCYIFRNNNGVWYKFDGSSYTKMNFTVEPSMGGNFVFTTPAQYTFYIPPSGGYGHTWNNSSLDFDYWDFTNEFDPSQMWISGWYVRYQGTHILDQVGDGEFAWVEDPVSNWPGFGKSIGFNNDGDNIYYFCSDGYVYLYNESNKTFTQLGDWLNDGVYNIFSFGTRLFFKFTGEVYEFLYNNAGTQNPMYIVTNIYSSADGEQYFGEMEDSNQQSHLYTVKDNKLGYVYDKTETVPTVPAQDGTYVLKATVLNGAVTYSWVPEV